MRIGRSFWSARRWTGPQRPCAEVGPSTTLAISGSTHGMDLLRSTGDRPSLQQGLHSSVGPPTAPIRTCGRHFIGKGKCQAPKQLRPMLPRPPPPPPSHDHSRRGLAIFIPSCLGMRSRRECPSQQCAANEEACVVQCTLTSVRRNQRPDRSGITFQAESGGHDPQTFQRFHPISNRGRRQSSIHSPNGRQRSRTASANAPSG